jgi:hypothetical protein
MRFEEQEYSAELRQLARSILVSTDPDLVERAIQASIVLQIALDLLREIGRPPDRPLRDTAKGEDLAAFCPGDQLATRTLRVQTDVADFVSWKRFEIFHRLGSRPWPRRSATGLREEASLQVLMVLSQLTALQLDQLRRAVEKAQPAKHRRSRRPQEVKARAPRLRRQAASLRRIADALDVEADLASDRSR